MSTLPKIALAVSTPSVVQCSNDRVLIVVLTKNLSPEVTGWRTETILIGSSFVNVYLSLYLRYFVVRVEFFLPVFRLALPAQG